MWKIKLNHYHKAIRFRLRRSPNTFILLICITAIGCRGILRPEDGDPFADHSFITGEPCEAPCWYGLELDKSNESAIVDTLNGLPFIESGSVYTFTAGFLDDDQARRIHFDCIHPVRKDCGLLTVSSDKLKQINLAIVFQLKLDAVVRKLGPPEYMDYGPIHIDVGGCQIHLAWPSLGISVSSYNENADKLCNDIRDDKKISPGVLVTDVVYAANESFGPSPGGCCIRIPWPGFSE